jgi:hypothetical protein
MHAPKPAPVLFADADADADADACANAFGALRLRLMRPTTLKTSINAPIVGRNKRSALRRMRSARWIT